VHPGATEVCDPDDVDEDCDGSADNDDVWAEGKTVTFVDADADGFGAEGDVGAQACEGQGRAARDEDCDDGDATVNPAAADPTDGAGIDDDCDGFVDEDGLNPGDLLLTEYFNRGDDVIDYTTWLPDGAFQWFEFRNDLGVRAELGGWTLTLCYVPGSYITFQPSAADCTAGNVTTVEIPAGTRVAPGDFLVLCSDATVMTGCDIFFPYAAPMTGMSIRHGYVALTVEGVTLGPRETTAPEDLAMDGVGYYATSTSDYWPSGASYAVQLESTTYIGAADATVNDAYGTAGSASPNWTTWCYADTSDIWSLSGVEKYGTPGSANESECP